MRRIAGAAALVAVLTITARLAGIARTLTFNWAVGPNDLGDIYLAANTVPNIIFEIVAGGALASLVVPLLAGAVARGDRASVGATASALLTWTVSILAPVAVAVALAAEPIMAALDRTASPDQIAVGAGMLRVFAPQLPLYGIGIVLTGVLQAHHRFAWPVLAPLLSSVTVMGTYVAFALVDGKGTDLATVTPGGQLVLSIGTTLGVAVLTLCLLIPLRRLAVPLRPRYAVHVDLRRSLARLAWAGAVTVAAQQVALVVVLKYALAAGPDDGAVVLFNLAQTVYLLPWAVLAVPVATAAYPVLAANAATGEPDRYRATLAGATRAVLLLSCLGAAALAALAGPTARLLIAVMPGDGPPPGQLAGAIAAFAPGLVGYGLSAALTRALYAHGNPGDAAFATVVGWAVVGVASAALASALPAADRVAALAAANSIGMTVLGAVLLVAVARRAGPGALDGLGRAALAGFAGAGAGLAAGLVVGAAWHTPGVGATVVQGMLSGVAVALGFLAVTYAIDRRDMTPLVERVRRLVSGRGEQRVEG